MNKILYVTTVSRTINAFLIPHIEQLLNKGYEVHCACYVDKPLEKRLLDSEVKVFNIPFSRNPLGFNNIKAFFKLIRLQKENKYNIIHVHTPIAAIYGRLLKLIFKEVKTIYTAHGYHFLKGGSKLGWVIYYPIERLMAKLTDATININKEDYDITKDKLKPKNCYLLPGVGIELTKYKKIDDEKIQKKRLELGLNKKDFVLLMIAELNKNKNHIQLIKAMNLLKDKYKDIKVIFVGEGKMLNELIGQVSKKNLGHNIKFLGFRSDINELINISDIGILLSHREGLPRNLMEFMACGRKVIATDIRGCRDIVCHESVGTLVPLGDELSTAVTIEKYYLQRKNGFQVSHYIQHYDMENIKEKLINIYIDVQASEGSKILNEEINCVQG